MRLAMTFGVLMSLWALGAAEAEAPPTPAIGPSTQTPPYILRVVPDVSVTSILTVGDAVGVKPDGSPWRMAGSADGLGAFDNGDGTITVLMDHELKRDWGVPRAHGFKGAFVSKLVIDKASLRVVRASDLIEKVFDYDAATGGYGPAKRGLASLCSADLAGGSAVYDAASGLGYDGRIFMSGEEERSEGRAFAHFVTGPEAGHSYELPALGKMAFENLVAHPQGGKRTIVAAMDDTKPFGQVYFYVGEKQAAGDAVTRAGLANGQLYGLKLVDLTEEPVGAEPFGADRTRRFTLADLSDVRALSGADLDLKNAEAGVTGFMRPEDGAWDRLNPNRFYFNSTGAPDKPSRLWAVDFDDIAHPEKGGVVQLMLKGDEGQVMLDNMTVTANGQLLLQEDPDEAHVARILQFDPAIGGKPTMLAQLDPALFSREAAKPLSLEEESSGILDVTPLLGSATQRAFLLTVQTHEKLKDDELVNGGQLLLMRQVMR